MVGRKSIQGRWALLGIVILASLAIIRVVWMSRTGDEPAVVLYSGRSQDLIQPLLVEFTRQTGIRVHARYGQTAEMAAMILEEGRRSPADVFFAQDAGALGALARRGTLSQLPDALLQHVHVRFRSPDGKWIGLSGRARVMIYDHVRLSADDLPERLADLCDSQWRGRVGWAPANGSFQAFVTAMRYTQGEEAAAQWLRCMRANNAREYAGNTPIVLAVAAGEVDLGLVNHYYLHALQHRRNGELRLRNHVPAEGVLMNVAGLGILETSPNRDAAQQLVEFLLSEPAQRFFADQIFEYPLAAGIEPHASVPSLDLMQTLDLDLNRLDDLEQTLRLLESVGLL